MVKRRNDTVHLFVEGGGDSADLKKKLRSGFAKFFKRAGLTPAIHAGGGREQTYDKFRTGVGDGKCCVLLVDSEDLVAENGSSAWEHFNNREGDKHWTKPENASDDAAHLMVCCMESWFLADRVTLKSFFGPDFNETKLPHPNNPVESVSKQQVYTALERATKPCKSKKTYDKGTHSFDLIGQIDPAKVENASPWARKLFEKLRKICK